jgi:hypothetical protein
MTNRMDANDLLAHPQVLWAAWARVKRWYAFGDGPPQPEFARWLAYPEEMLEALGES